MYPGDYITPDAAVPAVTTAGAGSTDILPEFTQYYVTKGPGEGRREKMGYGTAVAIKGKERAP